LAALRSPLCAVPDAELVAVIQAAGRDAFDLDSLAEHSSNAPALEAALRLVAARGRLMASMPRGDMLAVALPEPEVAALLAGEPGLELAAVNAPAGAVVSGPAEAVERLAARLAGDPRGVGTRRLRTSHAFHSAAMEPILDRFAELVAAARPRRPRLPFVSNVTGGWIEDGQATDPAYWARQLRSTVRFADGLATLAAEPGLLLLEVGPGRTLTGLARQRRRGADAAAGEPPAAVASLPGPASERPELDHLLGAAGRLWTAGVEIDWEGFRRGRRGRRVPLPTYPFERRRFWIDGMEAEPPAAAGDGADGGPEDAAPRGEREEAIAGVWRSILGVERVGRHDDFFELGGSSLAGVRLGSRLREALGVELPSGFLLESATVAELAERVEALTGGADGDGAAAPAPSCLVRLAKGSPGTGRRPLFMVHQVGGHVYSFRDLARELGGGRPFYALRSLGLEDGEEPLGTIGEMAEHYLGLVRGEQPRGPYLLGGASMGGMVAFEMAHRLAAAGERVELLVLMDTPCGDQMPAREDNADPVWLVVRDRTGLELDSGALAGLPVAERFERALAAVEEAGLAERLDVGEARRLARVIEANVEALYAYRPVPLDTRVLFFRAAERRTVDPPRPELPWIELGRGGTETVVVPGDHESMHRPPHVAEMAGHLRRRLDATRGAAGC
jgi:thioesterase domain-containing protein/acyl carrier protein